MTERKKVVSKKENPQMKKNKRLLQIQMNYSKAQKYMFLQSDLHSSFMVSKIGCPLQF